MPRRFGWRPRRLCMMLLAPRDPTHSRTDGVSHLSIAIPMQTILVGSNDMSEYVKAGSMLSQPN